jgi:PPP family 3-phenylpropionic acid transporter
MSVKDGVVIRLPARIPRADGFALRMAMFYATFFPFGGIQMPYLPAWLQARGLDAREIGIVLAVPMLVRIVAVPLATRLIDRRGEMQIALAVAATLGAVGYAMMGLAGGFIAIFAAYAAISAVSAPVLPLADSYGLRGLRARGLAYGPLRLWGSVAFIFANMGGGVLLSRLGAGHLVWVLAATMAATAVATWRLPRSPDGATAATRKHASSGLWRSGVFVAVIVGASLIQASHAVLYGFVTLQWTRKGLDGTTIGLLWAVGVLAEILLFAVSARVIGYVGAVEMILLGGIGAVLRWTAMAFDPPAILLPLLQCLHCLSFGATISAPWMCSRSSRTGALPRKATFPRCRPAPSPLRWELRGTWSRRSAVPPISQWRRSPPLALLSRLPRDERGASRVRPDEARFVAGVDARAHRGSTGRHNRGELAALQENHLRGEAAASRDPAAQIRGIDVHHRLAGGQAADPAAISRRPPCGVEPEHGLGGGADLVAGKHADHERAGRQAGAVDDDLFAGGPCTQEPFGVIGDQPATVGRDQDHCAG